MFWKNFENKIDLSFDLDDRRESYRHRPDQTFKITIDDHNVDVYNISVGGLSFYYPDLSVGQIKEIKLNVFGEEYKLSIEIIHIRENGLCACKFVDLSDDEVTQLHKFIIEEQKLSIRNKESN